MPTLLVTGANRGIGREFVRQYGADGWEVIATVRDPAEAGAIEGAARVETLDMRDLAAVERFGARLAGAPLDLLIANAGTWGPQRIESAGEAEGWLEALTVNSVAPVLLAHSVLANVRAASGKLVAITSRMGSIADNGSGGYIAYRSSKAALNAAWRSLAIDGGLVAAVLHPGWVQTRMGGASAPLAPEESVANMRRTIADLGEAESGGFFNHDGTPIPW
jgi:NAD(P)-dependent dehydrogenase (short-subunit alcohol dehydrogenase family)